MTVKREQPWVPVLGLIALERVPVEEIIRGVREGQIEVLFPNVLMLVRWLRAVLLHIVDVVGVIARDEEPVINSGVHVELKARDVGARGAANVQTCLRINRVSRAGAMVFELMKRGRAWLRCEAHST